MKAVPALVGVLLAAAAAPPCGPAAAQTLPPGANAPTVAAPTAPVDTVTVTLEPFAGAPRLRALRVEPGTVDFGGLLRITGEGDAPLAAADSLVLPPWLAAPEEAARGGGSLVLRVYRLDPFRVEVGGLVSDVVTVRGAGTDGSRTAPVRDPRALGWNLLFILGLVSAAVLLALLGRWIWRRRRGPRPRPADSPVPGVAWPHAAVALAEVLDRRRRQGDDRAFLDGLAGVARGYVAARFGIAGREMTGDEIAAACRGLGHGTVVGGAFARVLNAVDARRYDPRPVEADWCRERASELLAAIASVRLAPGPTPLPPEELAAGEEAWNRLVRELQPERGVRT